jgi:hypothetical protein
MAEKIKGIIYMTPLAKINPRPRMRKSVAECKWGRAAGKPPVRQTDSGSLKSDVSRSRGFGITLAAESLGTPPLRPLI